MKNIPDLIIILLILGTIFLLSFSSIGTNKANDPPSKLANKINSQEIPDSLFISGDLIFRDGRGIISAAFRRLSLTDPRYSHAGIIHSEKGKLFVYHILGGEGNKNNKMRKELLSNFCSPLHSNSFAVYRTDQNGNRIDSLAEYYFRKKLEFDIEFNLKTDNKMYCTELIYKILKKVSGQDNYLPLTTLSGVTYESCDNIYLSHHSKKIYSINYSF